MASEERIRQLAAEHLVTEGSQGVDIDRSVVDSGVSSVAVVAFVRLVGQELNVDLPPEDVSKMSSIRDLINYIDAKSG